MNTYNFNDQNFKSMPIYQTFIKNNASQGYLKIRASAASEALPISNLKIEVSKIIEGNKIIFFEGNTDSSGVIEKIVLPTPKLNQDNLLTPQGESYDIKATYDDNLINIYHVNIYENIYVVQTINIVPSNKLTRGALWL